MSNNNDTSSESLEGSSQATASQVESNPVPKLEPSLQRRGEPRGILQREERLNEIKEDAARRQATKKAEAKMSLDDLLDKHLSGPEYQQENHKGINYNEVLENLPSDAKKVIQNLRSDYQRKTSDLSRRRKELESRERTLLENSAENFKKHANLPEDIDLYNPEGLKQYIEAQAAKQLENMLAPAREKMKRQTRVEQVKAFEAQHPDLPKYKEGIAKLIQEKNMSIEDAYFRLKGEEFNAAMEKKNAEIENYKRAVRDAGMKISTGTPSAKAKPKFQSAYQVYEYLKSQGKT